MDRYCLPATTIHAISHMTFPAIVSYEAPFSTSRSILFFANDKTMNLENSTKDLERSTLTVLHVTSHSEIDSSHWPDGSERRKHLANI